MKKKTDNVLERSDKFSIDHWTMETSQTPQSDVKIKQPPGMRAKLSMLSKAMNLDDSKRHAIKSLFTFDTKHVPVYDTEFLTDVCFSFWGFLKNEDSWKKIIYFLCWCLQPRVFLAGKVDSGRLEVFMVVKLTRLCITRSNFETWLESFLDAMNMSAGSHFFNKYMDEQMLTCVERIRNTEYKMTNIHSEWNRDFCFLCTVLSKQRKQDHRVHDATGLEFDPNCFIKLFSDYQHLSILLKSATNELVRLRSGVAQPSTPVFHAVLPQPLSYGEVFVLQRSHISIE